MSFLGNVPVGRRSSAQISTHTQFGKSEEGTEELFFLGVFDGWSKPPKYLT